MVIFFPFYFNGSSCNLCPFPLVFLQGIAKNSGPYPLLFPISFITHIDKTPPPRASFFQAEPWLYLSCRSLHYLLVLFWASEKLWNWTHTPPVQLRNHECTCRYKGGTYLWPQCHSTSSKITQWYITKHYSTTSSGAAKCSQGKRRARESKLLNFMLKQTLPQAQA